MDYVSVLFWNLVERIVLMLLTNLMIWISSKGESVILILSWTISHSLNLKGLAGDILPGLLNQK